MRIVRLRQYRKAASPIAALVALLQESGNAVNVSGGLWSAVDANEPLAGPGYLIMVEVYAPYRFACLKHEASDLPEQVAPSIFVDLKPCAARVLNREAPCIMHSPLQKCGRFGKVNLY